MTLPFPSLATSMYRTCNCACQRCMSGGCCMDTTPDWSQPSSTFRLSAGTSAEIVCGPIDHDYSVLDPATLFCRKCGSTKAVR